MGNLKLKPLLNLAYLQSFPERNVEYSQPVGQFPPVDRLAASPRSQEEQSEWGRSHRNGGVDVVEGLLDEKVAVFGCLEGVEVVPVLGDNFLVSGNKYFVLLV